MKRISVAGIIHGKDGCLLLGRRGKEPNKGLYVLPGGGVEDGETLEEAFCREILEETGIEIRTESYSRWFRPDIIELPDRLILIAKGQPKDENALIKTGSDLYDVGWYDFMNLPPDISPVVKPTLASYGFHPRKF